MKICKTCLQSLPEESFPFYKSKRQSTKRQPHCIACSKKKRADQARKWRKENPEKAKLRKKRWEKRHPEKHREALQRRVLRRKSDPEIGAHDKEVAKKWVENNRDHLRDYAKKWKQKNKKRLQKYFREYRKTKPIAYLRAKCTASYQRCQATTRKRKQRYKEEGRLRHHKLIRRARKKDAKGHTTSNKLQQKLAYYGNRCRYCRAELATDKTFDHAIPLKRGGTNWTANFLPACRRCNSAKGTRTFKEFLGL